MTNRDDIEPLLNDADVTSETRLGADHFPHDFSDDDETLGSPYESRRIPPSGDVSPDGTRIWPQPSTTSKLLVWGGVGIAAAAVTAGTVLAARHAVDLMRGADDTTGDRTADKQKRPLPRKPKDFRAATLAPRFADMTDSEQAAIRTRARLREYEDELRVARRRAEAAEEALRQERSRPRSRPRRKAFLEEIEQNARKLGGSVDQASGSLGAAFSGFRSVASQAAGLIGEFEAASRLIRALMSKDQPAEAPPSKSGPSATGSADEAHDPESRRTHRL